MIDVEFIVQYLVLGACPPHPDLTGNLGNIALLGSPANSASFRPRCAAQLPDAYREFRRLQHALRLEGAQYARVAPETVADKVRAVRELWATVFGAYLSGSARQ